MTIEEKFAKFARRGLFAITLSAIPFACSECSSTSAKKIANAQYEQEAKQTANYASTGKTHLAPKEYKL